jgi:hypothetical protein
MEDMPACENPEQEEELPPSLSSVYKLYRDNLLQEFVDAAEMLLDEDVKLIRFDTIHLLILLANSVEAPEETREYYNLARVQYRMAQLYHQESQDEIRAAEELGARLDRIREVVEVEQAEEAERAVEAEEAEVMRQDTFEDSELLGEGADDREHTFYATKIETTAMALRVRTP